MADEVPEADQRRAQVKAAVEAFAEVFPRVRVLVISRTLPINGRTGR
jgi:hypothetical protein